MSWVCVVDNQKNLSGTIHRTGRPMLYLEAQGRKTKAPISPSASFSATVHNRLAANFIAISALQTLTLL
jgi:hypothetical protein